MIFWALVWCSIGWLTFAVAIWHGHTYKKKDVTIDDVVSSAALGLLGPIIAVLCVYFFWQDWFDRNKGKVLFKPKKD